VRSRATLVLLALLLALGAAALLVQRPGSADRVRDHAPVFPGLDAASVRAVTIARAGAEVRLSREGAAWNVGADRQPADGAAVEALLADLAGLEVSAVVSRNAAKQAVYETDAEQGVVVRLAGAGDAVIAAFTVGKRGPDFASTYLKRDGEKEVLLVSRDVRTPLSRPDWREPPRPAPAGP
jgi:hypothetical protein